MTTEQPIQQQDPALRSRIGSHAEVLARMLEAGRRRPALQKLSAPARDDPAIALLDAWAVVADVLSFYQERIADEGYLRSATEARSVRELAGAIGYEPYPGVAAGVDLVFTVEEAPGAPAEVPVPQGTRVLSLPGQSQLPQTFETSREFVARAAWNALRPAPAGPAALAQGTQELYLAGLTQRIQPGDAILVVNQDAIQHDFRIVTAVEPVSARGHTRIAWAEGLAHAYDSGAYTVWIFRQVAAIFGHNATAEDAKPVFDDNQECIDLDATYPRILPGSWLVLSDSAQERLYQVQQAQIASQAAYGLAAKVTRLVFEQPQNLASFTLRETSVFAQSEQLTLAPDPDAELRGDQIELDRPVEGLPPGQHLAISGISAEKDNAGVSISEIAVLARVEANRKLVFTKDLQHTYVCHAVTLNANVVPATHGETVRDEVLGSGDGGQANQRFTLRKPPLTYVQAENAAGAASTLEVFVDGVRWQEVPTLFGQGPRAQCYTVRHAEDCSSTLIFGDGRQGARLPSGAENVRASYRSGSGAAGNVGVGQLMLLQTRPPGIRAVSNPLPAHGGVDPESLAQARAVAPLTVRTLERVVARHDFADFARRFRGIARAHASQLSRGDQRIIHLTIAGDVGQAVPGATRAALREAIAACRAPGPPLEIADCTLLKFDMAATLQIDPRRQPPAVLAQVAATLREHFSFARRDFGQGVAAAELIAVIQAVPGVVAVDLDLLARTPEGAAQPSQGVSPYLAAQVARVEADATQPAEILVIHKDNLHSDEATGTITTLEH